MDGYLNFFFLFRARIHSRVLTRVAFDGHFSSTNIVNDNRNNNCHERENNTILKFLLNFQPEISETIYRWWIFFKRLDEISNEGTITMYLIIITIELIARDKVWIAGIWLVVALANRQPRSVVVIFSYVSTAPNQCYGQFTREISYKTLDLSTHQSLPLPSR